MSTSNSTLLSAADYPDGCDQSRHDREFDGPTLTAEQINEKAADLVDGDLIFEAISEGSCTVFEIDLINAVWQGDQSEIGRLVMARVDSHAKAVARYKAARGEL
ncbi:hypothetical protein [Zhongshania sp.]|uniref:hypothetical protein n=1 Tax=Zhongshania sp. TaxID=1971902 RepID=UPI003568B9F8